MLPLQESHQSLVKFLINIHKPTFGCSAKPTWTASNGMTQYKPAISGCPSSEVGQTKYYNTSMMLVTIHKPRGSHSIRSPAISRGNEKREKIPREVFKTPHLDA